MRALFLTLVPAGVALAVLGYEIQVSSLHSPDSRAVGHVAVGLSFLVCGLLAWSLRPANRLGSLMAAAGFALLLRPLRYSHDGLAFTIFFLLADLGFALVAHSVLCYPSGRMTDRLDRAFVRTVYVTALAFPLAVLLLHDLRDPLMQFGSLRRRSDILVARDAGVVEFLQNTYVIVFFGALAALFVLLLVRRVRRAAPRARRDLSPLALAGAAVVLLGLYECVYAFGNRSFASDYLFWAYVASFLALPVALLTGLLRTRPARATVGELVVQLEQTPAHGLRDALARGLGDPTLQLALWLPERRGFADEEGRPVAVPEDGRAVTRLEHDGEPLAMLIHDPALLDEPELIEAVAAAARLALENARLSAELRAQLEKVKESRARIVAATDAERQRIERDIHDGAQQRLVAVALALRSAQLRLKSAQGRDVEHVLAAAVDDLQTAVEELRELARGVHPAILTEEGLAAALESLVLRAPLPVDLIQAPELRLKPEVEATAYFVACEGLTNVVKHARASAVEISAQRRNALLLVEVADDGVGGAELDAGSGLRGLADRVEALGGRLRVDSRVSEGTRIVAEIPCGS